ncbi:hypothetical protein N7486_010430 [Penicillium sp. IBT 16267x]|nr:hypothetical protein N7486_010430 [Penicillium sp. IBT 16267x]
MPNQIRDIETSDESSHPYIFRQNVSVPVTGGRVIRCNIYHPKAAGKYPVLMTYGSYGKDVPYESFHPASFAEVNPDHKSEHSAWETPFPAYWTAHGYIVIRADELGLGQSPGLMDVLSATTVDSFFELIEWASVQEWSTGKIGLLGVSYYAAMQWQVAARNPKGLAAFVAWEGFSDFYRDASRHGGILSNAFLQTWYKRQVLSNQYGLPGRASRNWGPDTVEGDLSSEELTQNSVDTLKQLQLARFRDDERFSSCNFDLEGVTVPLLSVANWGGYLLHLRGNVEGFTWASSEFKYLRFITGRHDLPFYYADEVEIQRNFLDAFLKDEDRVGWSVKHAVPAVDLVLRKGDVGFNNPEGEALFPRRREHEWPIARTTYVPFFLGPDHQMSERKASSSPKKIGYRALGSLCNPESISFQSPPFQSETEVTGHIVAHLNVSVSKDPWGPVPSDIDIFITLRHFSASEKEIFYTGTVGDAAPVAKGSLRVSLRKVNSTHRHHRSYLPYREYTSSEAQLVLPNEVYAVDIEMWPTNVVVQPGETLVFEVSSGDTQGTGIFEHSDPVDRSPDVFQGMNFIHFGPRYVNSVTLPIIPLEP